MAVLPVVPAPGGLRFQPVDARAYRAGDNLNLDTAVRGPRTWEDFLAERLGAAVG